MECDECETMGEVIGVGGLLNKKNIKHALKENNKERCI